MSRGHVRTLGAVVFVALLGSGTATSDELWSDLKKKDAAELAAGQTDFWVRTLALDSAQRALLQAINAKYAAMTTATARGEMADGSKRVALELVDDAKSKEILEILTLDQRSRYEAMTKRMRDIAKQGLR